MILFRHADPRYPFLVEAGVPQATGRWNKPGDGPTQYFADTPDGAWAEFLRHEEIRDPADLEGIQRTIWAVEVEDLPAGTVSLPEATLTGGFESYPVCQTEAHRLRAAGASGLVAKSAALLPGGARGWRVRAGLQQGPERMAGRSCCSATSRRLPAGGPRQTESPTTRSCLTSGTSEGTRASSVGSNRALGKHRVSDRGCSRRARSGAVPGLRSVR